MKIFNFKSVFGLFLLPILLMGTSCKKQLDINQNPNVPTLAEGNAMLAFPAGVLATVGKVGGDLTILGGIYSEYYTQASASNQYKYIDAYDVKSTDFNASYDILYANGLKNYQSVINKAKASGDWSYYLMGTVMKAYTTAILVDLYDKIPYFEALQGTGNMQPKFDDGLTIYKDLLSSIDTALSKNFTAPTSSVVATVGFKTSDLVFDGDITKWKAFANTLKLKFYLRMINTQPALAQAGIAALYSSNAAFLTSDAGVLSTKFTDAPGKDNPFYEQNIRMLNTPDNIRASTTFVSWLSANKDPRVITYFGKTNPATINQGDYNSPNKVYLSAPDFVQTATDPVLFISKAESYFLQAEADLRYLGGNKAQALYNQGVLAAFAATGNDGTAFITGAYAFPVTGTLEQKVEAIVTQKWASFPFGCHAIEGFFERNRTGYPKSSDVPYASASYKPGQFVLSPNSVLSAGQYPKRLIFPYDETSRNSNAPALVPSIVAVWWGK